MRPLINFAVADEEFELRFMEWTFGETYTWEYAENSSTLTVSGSVVVECEGDNSEYSYSLVIVKNGDSLEVSAEGTDGLVFEADQPSVALVVVYEVCAENVSGATASAISIGAVGGFDCRCYGTMGKKGCTDHHCYASLH